jgi:hypothetical protein
VILLPLQSRFEIKDCHSALLRGNAMGNTIMHVRRALGANRIPSARNCVFGPACLKSKSFISQND